MAEQAPVPETITPVGLVCVNDPDGGLQSGTIAFAWRPKAPMYHGEGIVAPLRGASVGNIAHLLPKDKQYNLDDIRSCLVLLGVTVKHTPSYLHSSTAKGCASITSAGLRYTLDYTLQIKCALGEYLVVCHILSRVQCLGRLQTAVVDALCDNIDATFSPTCILRQRGVIRSSGFMEAIGSPEPRMRKYEDIVPALVTTDLEKRMSKEFRGTIRTDRLHLTLGKTTMSTLNLLGGLLQTGHHQYVAQTSLSVEDMLSHCATQSLVRGRLPGSPATVSRYSAAFHAMGYAAKNADYENICVALLAADFIAHSISLYTTRPTGATTADYDRFRGFAVLPALRQVYARLFAEWRQLSLEFGSASRAVGAFARFTEENVLPILRAIRVHTDPHMLDRRFSPYIQSTIVGDMRPFTSHDTRRVRLIPCTHPMPFTGVLRPEPPHPFLIANTNHILGTDLVSCIEVVARGIRDRHANVDIDNADRLTAEKTVGNDDNFIARHLSAPMALAPVALTRLMESAVYPLIDVIDIGHQTVAWRGAVYLVDSAVQILRIWETRHLPPQLIAARNALQPRSQRVYDLLKTLSRDPSNQSAAHFLHAGTTTTLRDLKAVGIEMINTEFFEPKSELEEMLHLLFLCASFVHALETLCTTPLPPQSIPPPVPNLRHEYIRDPGFRPSSLIRADIEREVCDLGNSLWNRVPPSIATTTIDTILMSARPTYTHSRIASLRSPTAVCLKEMFGVS